MSISTIAYDLRISQARCVHFPLAFRAGVRSLRAEGLMPVTMTTSIWTARAVLVNGTTVDLLQFSTAADAGAYVAYLRGLRILGFDRIDVIECSIIGAIAERRTA